MRPGSFETPGFPDDAYSWDKDGPDLWVDFCYAPGHYADVIAFLKSRCAREIGWYRQKTGDQHRIPIGKLRTHSLLRFGSENRLIRTKESSLRAGSR
jgi:hypothetical protein